MQIINNNLFSNVNISTDMTYWIQIYQDNHQNYLELGENSLKAQVILLYLH